MQSEMTRLIEFGILMIVHIFLIVATIGMAAEKNRKPILWLPFAMFLSPITFVVSLCVKYSGRSKIKSNPTNGVQERLRAA